MSNNQIFYNREEKLKYVLKALKISTNDIAKKLEITAGLVSQIQNHYNSKLKKVHLYAIAYAYNIPIEIFEKEEIDTKDKIDKLLIQMELNSVFKKNHELIQKLIGKWYLYSYPSNPKVSEVWKTEIYIYDDLSVLDAHRNRGKIYMGEKQSLIIKQSHNSKNLTITAFDNDRVTYENFPFSRIAKSNSVNREILSFGFFSRDKIDKKEAKEILGELSLVQLQIDYDFIDRISGVIKIRG